MQKTANRTMLVTAAIATFACGIAALVVQQLRKTVPASVVNVDKSDNEMNASIIRAKSDFHLFEMHWKEPDVDGYSVKLAMETDAGGDEHIWFTPLKIDGQTITAECANDPINVPGLKLGDIRTVERAKISDWMIVKQGKCYGGYTIRVLSGRDPSIAPPLVFADFQE